MNVRLNQFSSNDINSFFYRIESPSDNTFQIDKMSADIWLKGRHFSANKTMEIIIAAYKNTQDEIYRLSLSVEKICFWDTITFRTAENEASNTSVGVVAPRFYHELCEEFSIKYVLMNETKYLGIQEGVLYNRMHLDRDQMSPGPILSPLVQCQVQQGENSIPKVHEREFNVVVLDRNDNQPYIQNYNSTIEIYLDDPHFMEVSTKKFLISGDFRIKSML